MSQSQHIVPLKLYVGVFLALLALTALTTGVAYIDLGPYNTVAALVIAVVKMSLVVLFFMHLWYSNNLTRLVIVSSVFWLALLVMFSLADVLTRHWSPVASSWGPSIANSLLH
jgi:cytochrome c oxidase subunit IV